MENNISIILTGAQGTGKTTILNEFKKEGWKVITEVVRKLHKEGININEMGDSEGQTKIFETYLKELDSPEAFVSDRGLTDVMAYTAYLASHNPSKVNDEFFISQFKQWLGFTQTHPNIIYCYFPIEFDVVDDGVRSTNEAFREEIDGYIKMFFEKTGVPYIKITGTVEERLKIIKDTLDELNKLS